MLRESKFVKSLAASTTLVDGRIQVKMPWKEGGPPKRSNYDIALKRMLSAERGFMKKGCFEVVKEEVQKLLDQNFITMIPPEQIAHDKPEWYLPLQAVFTPERTTKVRLVFDSSSKGHDGLSLNDYLEKDLTSSIVFWMYWQHGDGTKWRSLVTFVKCSTKSWYILRIRCTTGFFGGATHVTNQLFTSG